MGPLRKKLTRLLKPVFPAPDKVRVEFDEGIVGYVTSRRFLGLEGRDRQDLIWGALDGHLTPDEQRNIAIIVGQTPEEELAHSESSDDLQSNHAKSK